MKADQQWQQDLMERANQAQIEAWDAAVRVAIQRPEQITLRIQECAEKEQHPIKVQKTTYNPVLTFCLVILSTIVIIGIVWIIELLS